MKIILALFLIAAAAVNAAKAEPTACQLLDGVHKSMFSDDPKWKRNADANQDQLLSARCRHEGGAMPAAAQPRPGSWLKGGRVLSQTWTYQGFRVDLDPATGTVTAKSLATGEAPGAGATFNSIHDAKTAIDGDAEFKRP